MNELPKFCPARCDELEKAYRKVRRQLYMAYGQLKLWTHEGQSPMQSSLACYRDAERILQETPYIGEPECMEAGHAEGKCGNASCFASIKDSNAIP